MSGVSGIGTNQADLYGQIASGNRLTRAANGAAELGIVERENSQTTGYEVGRSNAQSGIELGNIADGALGSITDYLQRIRELAVSASSDLLTDSDKQTYQTEIDGLLQGIQDVAEQTSYNTNPILDGSRQSFNLATDGNGGSAEVTTTNATLSALGIQGFNVTGSFSLDDIDNALQKVTDARTSIGAQTNSLEYLQNYNSTAAYQHTAVSSRMGDTDFPKAISDMKKQETLNQMEILMQKRKQEDEARTSKMFWT